MFFSSDVMVTSFTQDKLCDRRIVFKTFFLSCIFVSDLLFVLEPLKTKKNFSFQKYIFFSPDYCLIVMSNNTDIFQQIQGYLLSDRSNCMTLLLFSHQVLFLSLNDIL